MDSAGNLVIADTGNSRVRVVAASKGTFYGQVMTAGDIYTIAGRSTAGFPETADQAPQPNSSAPRGLAVDGAGNLVIVDENNGRLRELTG